MPLTAGTITTVRLYCPQCDTYVGSRRWGDASVPTLSCLCTTTEPTQTHPDLVQLVDWWRAEIEQEGRA